MTPPISPPPVSEASRDELPAYLSNGLVGLRVLDIPLLPGKVLVNGFAGLDPVVEVEAAAAAPYPLAADLAVDGVWLTTSPQQAAFVDQAYDFACGELRTRFRYRTATATADVEVVTFCSRKEPTVVVQEIAIEVDAACDLAVRATIDATGVRGRLARRAMVPPGQDDGRTDGSIAWESLGALSRCGVALATAFEGEADVERRPLDTGLGGAPAVEYRLRARGGRRYRVRQVAALVTSRLHGEPDREATRIVARAASLGFERLRADNRREWEELWKGRVRIEAADPRWQALADAAFYYLNASVHPSAPASTSIFGLATWNDYHYYYGHVMWDIDLFCVPPLALVQPDAARALLRFRGESLPAARDNARLLGRRGAQFPWESGPRRGEEAAPGSGKASWNEDHVTLDVAWGFTQYAHASGDERFLRQHGAPVLYDVADWITSRVTPTGRPRRFGLLETMGIAERERAADNDAFTLVGARRALAEAIATAERLGDPTDPAWHEVLAGLESPRVGRDGAIRTHDGFRPNEEKGATPGPLAALFPLWHDAPPEVARATLDYYLRLAPGYIGSPMLSPLYGVWAAWAGDRSLSARLYEEGYAAMQGGRFLQTLELAPDRFPEKPRSGPFFANLGGFLMGLMYGLPGIRLDAGDPGQWPCRPVVLPAGWESIEIERAWIRREPARIVARHGDVRARIERGTGTGRGRRTG